MGLEDELLRALNGYTPPSKQPKLPPNLADLFRATQPQPRPVVRLAKPKVFVSFDYDNDRNYKRLLEAWSANSRFQFTFYDKTPQEIQSNSVSRIKAVLTTKVQEASHILVLVGRYANQRHRDSQEIGHINWIHFECNQAMAYRKKLVAVLLQPTNSLPNNILGATGIRVDSFNQADIIAALNRA